MKEVIFFFFLVYIEKKKDPKRASFSSDWSAASDHERNEVLTPDSHRSIQGTDSRGWENINPHTALSTPRAAAI
jgi:hypothetical protein